MRKQNIFTTGEIEVQDDEDDLSSCLDEWLVKKNTEPNSDIRCVATSDSPSSVNEDFITLSSNNSADKKHKNRRYRHRERRFLDKWLLIDEMKGWLRKAQDLSGREVSYCNYCKVTMKPHLADMKKHMRTLKHHKRSKMYNHGALDVNQVENNTKHRFVNKWLKISSLKDWLTKSTDANGEEIAYCTICNCELMPHLYALKRHMATGKHLSYSYTGVDVSNLPYKQDKDANSTNEYETALSKRIRSEQRVRTIISENGSQNNEKSHELCAHKDEVNDIFGKEIAFHLKGLPLRKQIILRRDISNLITEALLENVQSDSNEEPSISNIVVSNL